MAISVDSGVFVAFSVVLGLRQASGLEEEHLWRGLFVSHLEAVILLFFVDQVCGCWDVFRLSQGRELEVCLRGEGARGWVGGEGQYFTAISIKMSACCSGPSRMYNRSLGRGPTLYSLQ